MPCRPKADSVCSIGFFSFFFPTHASPNLVAGKGKIMDELVRETTELATKDQIPQLLEKKWASMNFAAEPKETLAEVLEAVWDQFNSSTQKKERRTTRAEAADASAILADLQTAVRDVPTEPREQARYILQNFAFLSDLMHAWAVWVLCDDPELKNLVGKTSLNRYKLLGTLLEGHGMRTLYRLQPTREQRKLLNRTGSLKRILKHITATPEAAAPWQEESPMDFAALVPRTKKPKHNKQ